MCGIICIFDEEAASEEELRAKVLKCSKLLRHRGPDWSGAHVFHQRAGNASSCSSAALGHERLAVVDPDSGEQPLYNESRTVVLAANGEIYNHEKIRAQFPEFNFQTGSDCESIIPLYEKYGVDCVKHLDGMYAFVIWDEANRKYYAARDHMGIVPLYIGWTANGGVVFASELKALQGVCERFELFPPGHYFESGDGEMHQWYDPAWFAPGYMPAAKPLDLVTLREKFEASVVKRMMSDVPWGVLLSGGLDSSLVASIATRYAAKYSQHFPQMHSFSVGLSGSPDLAAAKKVADFLGTVHHSYEFTVQNGLDAITDVIYHLETFDITTIRSATPMYLMARKIKAMGIKMVLSGEGSDEALAGYLFFHKCPNKTELQGECTRLLKNLHRKDCLRANKAMSAFGVEPRVPFLDQEFLNYVMEEIDPEDKMCKVRPGYEKRKSMEKWAIRQAFDTPDKPYLPEEVLWRQKEQFSDGVGYNWIDSLKANAESRVNKGQWSNRAKRFPVNTPTTKEGYFYRAIFEQHFPSSSAVETVPGGPSVACSSAAAIEWDESFKKIAAGMGQEASGRAIAGVHCDSYSTEFMDEGDAAAAAPAAKKARTA